MQSMQSKVHSHLERVFMAEVLQYIPSAEDLFNVMQVKKAYRELNGSLKRNPFPVKDTKCLGYRLLTNVETLEVTELKDLNEKFQKVKRWKKKQSMEGLDWILPYLNVNDKERFTKAIEEKDIKTIIDIYEKCDDKTDVHGKTLNKLLDVYKQEYKEWPNLSKIVINVPQVEGNKFRGMKNFVSTYNQKQKWERIMVLYAQCIMVDFKFCVPDNWQLIPNGAFQINMLESIVIPEGIKCIGHSAFRCCISLKMIHIPASVKVLGKHSFENCMSLRRVTFEEDSRMIEIEKCSFKECPFESIELPKGCKKLGERVFSGCKNLKKLVLPEQLEKIPSYMVEGCKELRYFDIPASVKRYGKDPYKDSPCGILMLMRKLSEQ